MKEISLNKACKLLNCGSVRMIRYIKQGKILGRDEVIGKRTFYYIDEQSLRDFKKREYNRTYLKLLSKPRFDSKQFLIDEFERVRHATAI